MDGCAGEIGAAVVSTQQTVSGRSGGNLGRAGAFAKTAHGGDLIEIGASTVESVIDKRCRGHARGDRLNCFSTGGGAAVDVVGFGSQRRSPSERDLRSTFGRDKVGRRGGHKRRIQIGFWN